MRTKSSFSRAALAAAVSLLVSSSSFAASFGARPVPAPLVPAGALEGFEDQSVALPIALKPGQLSVDTAPANGTVQLDGEFPRYLPSADFSGTDSFVVKDHKGNTQTFNVTIHPVNDAPSFTGGNDLGHLSGTPGEFVVPGWASAVSAGPADEQLSQTLRFELTEDAENSEVIRSAWIDVDGTLHYVLTGAPGVGQRTVRLIDSGGGEDTSKAHVLRIGVGMETDLAIRREPASDSVYPWASYRLVVSNNGPMAVTAAQVAEIFASGGEPYRWSCAGYDGGHCGADAGAGPIDATVSLKVGGVVVFDVQSRDPLVQPGKYLAFVVPDPTMVDVNPSNNEVEN